MRRDVACCLHGRKCSGDSRKCRRGRLPSTTGSRGASGHRWLRALEDFRGTCEAQTARLLRPPGCSDLLSAPPTCHLLRIRPTPRLHSIGVGGVLVQPAPGPKEGACHTAGLGRGRPRRRPDGHLQHIQQHVLVSRGEGYMRPRRAVPLGPEPRGHALGQGGRVAAAGARPEDPPARQAPDEEDRAGPVAPRRRARPRWLAVGCPALPEAEGPLTCRRGRLPCTTGSRGIGGGTCSAAHSVKSGVGARTLLRTGLFTPKRYTSQQDGSLAALLRSAPPTCHLLGIRSATPRLHSARARGVLVQPAQNRPKEGARHTSGLGRGRPRRRPDGHPPHVSAARARKTRGGRHAARFRGLGWHAARSRRGQRKRSSGQSTASAALRGLHDRQTYRITEISYAKSWQGGCSAPDGVAVSGRRRA